MSARPDDDQLNQVILFEGAPVLAPQMERDLAAIATHEDLEAAIETFKASLRDRMNLAVI